MIVTHKYVWYKLGETEKLSGIDGFFFVGVVAENCLQAIWCLFLFTIPGKRLVWSQFAIADRISRNF